MDSSWQRVSSLGLLPGGFKRECSARKECSCLLVLASTLLAAVLLLPQSARAHPIDSATLLLEEKAQGLFQIRFQSGSPSLRAIDTPALYPSHCRLEKTALACGPEGLSGSIEFPWLSGSLTHLLVDIQWLDGSHLQRMVSPESAQLTVYDRGATGWAALWPVLSDYGWLGIEHILLGFDHLCLVFALTLLLRGRRRLVATISAFTVAHSITLALSALGLVRIPIGPVEAMIALSIVLVCAECLRPDDSLTRRAPWIVAFTFGLLHGFGFASALLEVGLPQARLPAALLGFNLGVELGQLAVVVLLLAVSTLTVRFHLMRPWIPRTVIYATGSVAAYWSIDRVSSVLSGLGG